MAEAWLSPTQPQSVKLLRPRLDLQPALQGERYIRLSEPHTGSIEDLEQEQAALHSDEFPEYENEDNKV